MKIKILFITALLIACGSIYAQVQSNKAPQPNNKMQMNAQKFATTMYLIDNFYVDTVNSDKVVEDAIIGALRELDPHSAYISKKDVEKLRKELKL